ncbi:hypothetical protein H8E77_39710 [bacterium]|nr:hypothetical protein [bacterium]
MEEQYLEQLLNAKFEATDDRLAKIEATLKEIAVRFKEMNGVNKEDAVAIENIRSKVLLISALVGAGVAAFLSALFSIWVKRW